MKKKHKAYRHITAENISISILQNHTIQIGRAHV